MLISRRAQEIQASPIRKLKPLLNLWPMTPKREEFIFSILTLATQIYPLPSQLSKLFGLTMIRFWAMGHRRGLMNCVRLSLITSVIMASN